MTQEELIIALENLEGEEHQETLAVVAALLAIAESLKISIAETIELWVGKYGVDGKLSRRAMAKSLTKTELRDFNRKYDYHYKRLNRGSALKLALTSLTFNSFTKSRVLFEKLGIDVGKLEQKTFGKLFGKPLRFGFEDLKKRNWGADDSNYDARLRSHFEKYNFFVNKTVSRAFYRNSDVSDIIDEINKRTDSLGKAVKRLMLTEAVAFSSFARKSIFEQLGIKYYMFYAMADERTCPECGELHGTKFPVSAYSIGITASPIHGHCRCFEVPIIED
jgi:SPP1 gp7 family putative phage head morphogenesis protein